MSSESSSSPVAASPDPAAAPLPSNADATSPRTAELNRVKSHLALARSRLALLTSAEGLSNFTLLVDEVNALLGSEFALPSNGGALQEHAGALRARVAKIDALGLLLDDNHNANSASSSSHKKKSRSSADDAASPAAAAAAANAASGKGSLRRRKKKPTALPAAASGGVTESEDEEASDLADDESDADSRPRPSLPLLFCCCCSAAARRTTAAAVARMEATCQCSQSVNGCAACFCFRSSSLVPDRRQSSDDTSAQVEAQHDGDDFRCGWRQAERAQSRRRRVGRCGWHRRRVGQRRRRRRRTRICRQTAGSSIRRWKREMSGEQADAFKRVIEERYGRNTSAAASFAQESAAAAAAPPHAAGANDLADEDDDVIVAARESGVPKKASRRTDLLARFRREKSAVRVDASSSLSSSTSPGVADEWRRRRWRDVADSRRAAGVAARRARRCPTSFCCRCRTSRRTVWPRT
jgi:hypothetical protein